MSEQNTQITLEFASAVIQDAKDGWMILCSGIETVAFPASSVSENCTFVDMATYTYESVPGNPGQLDIVHVQLRKRLPDTYIFSQDARNNLTQFLHQHQFFTGGGGNEGRIV